MKWVCSECGGDNVQVKAWINPNTDEIIESMGSEIEDTWCEDCEKHTGVELIKN